MANDALPASTLAALQRVPLQPAELAFPKSTVCVTGATGYLAGPIIERLLRAGHTVHATCRDPSRLDVLRPLLALPGASERLKLFKADLTQPGSFDAAVSRCDYVMHVAAPVLLKGVKPHEGRSRVVDPMMQGVDNVLGAVNRTPTVRRVVMTSSVTAISAGNFDKPRKSVYGPDDWNSAASDTFLPYFHGKTVSEQRAWELARQQDRWELVTVLPCIIWGPQLGSSSDTFSVDFLRDTVLKESLPVPDRGINIIDVRDVALVHCLALVTPGASGRYITEAHRTNLFTCTHALASRLPGFRAARFVMPFWLAWVIALLAGTDRNALRRQWGKANVYDTSRTLKDLSPPPWLPLADTLEDMVRDLEGKGVLRIN